jgi:hypothetical protein
MNDMQTATKINISVTVQVEVSSAWGDDWKIADIAKEARRVGVDALRNVLAKGERSQDVRFGIIGEPKVVAVLTPVS